MLRGFLLKGKICLDTLTYKQITDMLFQWIAFLYLHNHLEINNLSIRKNNNNERYSS